MNHERKEWNFLFSPSLALLRAGREQRGHEPQGTVFPFQYAFCLVCRGSWMKGLAPPYISTEWVNLRTKSRSQEAKKDTQ